MKTKFNIKLLLFFVITMISTVNMANNWVLDQRFASLDIKEIVHTDYPSLANKADLISHYSGYYSINPFLLSEYVMNNKQDIKLAAKYIANEIRNNSIHKTEFFKTTKINIIKMMDKYGISEQIKIADDNNFPAMDLPFNHDEGWFFNGIHTWTGDDNGTPMSAIDITKSWRLRWGDDTSQDWVTAAHAGTISVFSSCFVRITHTSGWATDYYHIDNVQFTNGDHVNAGERIANYADNLIQATCQGGSSTGPHVHFALVKNGLRSRINGKKLSQWKLHAGIISYDTNHANMWLERQGVKYFAYQNTVQHRFGDNIVDYRYSGIYSAPEINGHGLSINITQLKNASTGVVRDIIFLALYTYDDSGNANFYAGNRDFEQWRTDETKTIGMIQTSGGNLTDLQAINFDTDVVDAGEISLHFLSCGQVEVNINLLEPISGNMISKTLVLSQGIGIPQHVCESESIPIN